jgi:class 3 adenylate cyclase
MSSQTSTNGAQNTGPTRSTTSAPHRPLCVHVEVRDARYVAERIVDARRVTQPSSAHVSMHRERDATADARVRSVDEASRRHTGRFLTTVLMTDIVASTQTAARLGDRRWREVLADHYADSHAQVDEGGGEVVATTGDGMIAIFDGPTRAVQAAIAIQAAARACGIAVRAGIHTGECERLGDGLAGVAVHIAARICALGGGEEVMTTGTVRDVVIGSMLVFEPRGRHELRGVPGDWTIFSATDPGQAGPERAGRPGAPGAHTATSGTSRDSDFHDTRTRPANRCGQGRRPQEAPRRWRAGESGIHNGPASWRECT